MSFGHALYYPHINLTNKNWLKHAFLFWDKLSRIVPYSVDPCDSEDVIKIKYETGFIDNYSPDSWVIENTFHEFSRYLEEWLHKDEFYRHLRDKIPNTNWNYEHRHLFRNNLVYRSRMLRSAVNSSGSYLHLKKIDNRLNEKLISLGLAIPGDNEWDGWIKIDNEIGYIYMTYLARSISREKSIPIVTDNEQCFSASILFDPELLGDYNGKFEYKLGNLLVASCVPRDINSVPFDILINFREKYQAERINFFRKIADLCHAIPGIDNESSLRDALNMYSVSLMNDMEVLKKLYRAFKIDTVYKFLSVSVPSAAVSISNLIPVDYKSFGIGAGIVFGLVATASSVRKERIELQKNPLSYMLSIKSELSGQGLFGKINDSLKGIRKW